jgi:hypothetical protein
MKKISLFGFILLFTGMMVSCEKADTDERIALDTPVGLRQDINVEGRSANLYWEPVNDAGSYEVNIIGSATYSAFAASLVVNDLSYDVDYEWQVRAKKGDAYSEWSEKAAFRIADPVPVPRNLYAQLDGNNKATLSWSLLDVDSYEVDLNGEVHTATENRIVLDNLTPNTDYTWKVRAKRGDEYGNWSGTSNFYTVVLAVIKQYRGNWSSNDAVIRLLLGTDELNLDELMLRDPLTNSPVQVTVTAHPTNIEQSLMTVRGMDAYITGGETVSAFAIDNQLTDLPVSGNEQEKTISASKTISSNNVYTKTVHIKISDIPNYQEILGDMASWVASNYIETVSITVSKVTITGNRGNTDNEATYSFKYDVAIRITTDISSFILGLAGIDDINDELPTPQQLLSDVLCSK